MHPPEPVYPCYLPVLGEFNRMTPHEGPSDTLPEHPARLESASRQPAGRPAGGPVRFTGQGHCGNPLRITAPAAIIGMYTDWGNLKVVSCVAWLNGTGPGSSTVQQGMGALGASIFRLRQPSPYPFEAGCGRQKTDAGWANWAMRKTSGNLVPAFDSEAVGEFA